MILTSSFDDMWLCHAQWVTNLRSCGSALMFRSRRTLKLSSFCCASARWLLFNSVMWIWIMLVPRDQDIRSMYWIGDPLDHHFTPLSESTDLIDALSCIFAVLCGYSKDNFFSVISLLLCQCIEFEGVWLWCCNFVVLSVSSEVLVLCAITLSLSLSRSESTDKDLWRYCCFSGPLSADEKGKSLFSCILSVVLPVAERYDLWWREFMIISEKIRYTLICLAFVLHPVVREWWIAAASVPVLVSSGWATAVQLLPFCCCAQSSPSLSSPSWCQVSLSIVCT